MLIPCNLQGFTETLFCCTDTLVRLTEQEFSFQSKKFRLPEKFSVS